MSLVLAPPPPRHSTTTSSSVECLDENTALELLDGTLTSSARTSVEKHLEECDVCRELVAELAQIAGADVVSQEMEARPVDTERTPFASSPSRPGSGGQDFILAPGTRAGAYRIEHPIGSGAAGTVYRAVDERSGRIVALKHVTDSAMRTRFLREAETLRRLDHSGIVRYIDHGETSGGAMFLAMEWLEGEDLEAHMRRRAGGNAPANANANAKLDPSAKKIPWRDVRVIGERLAGALAHAHSFGAVHRDLSPKNVFLTDGRFDQAKLLDFGLVRIPDAGPERTASQAVLGTPFYMSPEQVRDPKSVDARSDLFGLGVLLFEMLSGKRPFEGEDLFTVWVRIVDQPAPDLRSLVPEVPEPFIRLVEALLAKEPDARPSSAGDVQRVLLKLEGLVDGSGSGQRASGGGGGGGGGGGTETLPPIRLPPPPQQHVAIAATHPPNRQLPVPPTGPPPPSTKRGSGVFVAASVGVGVTALVGATTFAVVYARDGSKAETSQAEAGSRATSSKTNASAKPDDDDENDINNDGTTPSKARAAAATTTSTSKSKAAPSPTSTKDKDDPPSSDVQSDPNLACGSDDVVVKRHGHFRPNPQLPKGMGDSVFAGGDCKLTLEDCVIDGPHSLQIMNLAVVTLRRCKVLGTVNMVGPKPILHLYDTTLPQAPSITGGGQVIKH